MAKRVVIFYCVLLLLFCLLIVRLLLLSKPDSKISEAAAMHGSKTLTVSTTRGTIYDADLKPLVNAKPAYYALVSPCSETPRQLAALSPYVEDVKALEKKLAQRTPFVVQVSSANVSAPDVQVVTGTDRYAESISPQLIGYVNGDGDGVTGIEKAFDKELKEFSSTITAAFPVDARKRELPGLSVDIRQEGEGDAGGVVLTLKKDVQLAAQKAADKYMKSGAVVVMDPKTGDILALCSNPTYSQNDIVSALKNNEGAMTVKAFSAYNLGSVFKIAVSATALESGITPQFSYTCQNSINIGGNIFHDAESAPHGTETMAEGFSNSCNTYFINLGQKVGADPIMTMARRLGFGQPNTLAPGITSKEGNLPTESEIALPAELANLSIGQGRLLATPIQVARMVSAVANGGMEPTAKLVNAIVDENKKTVKTYPSAAPDRVFSENTASTVRQFMIKTVQEGTGMPGKPTYGGAGGKTGTAQTGVVQGEKTIDRAWFAGFYPAQSPKYVIVAIVENGVAGGSDAGPVFKAIADALAPSCGYPAVAQ